MSASPIERLRNACLQRGVNGIRMIGRTFRTFDDNGSRTLDRNELKNGLLDYGLKMTTAEVYELFDCLDKDKSGSVSFDEFLEALRPPMSKARLEMIDKAFRKMDVNKDGVITVEDLKINYSVTHHKDYINGQRTREQILQEFLNTFQPGGTPDEEVTKEEFINYYSGVSASVDDDDYFVFMMKQAWKL